MLYYFSIDEHSEVNTMLKQINIENAHLLSGLFMKRSDINRAYNMELKTKALDILNSAADRKFKRTCCFAAAYPRLVLYNC